MNELGHGTGPFGELCREATRNGIYKPADQVGDTGNTRYFRMGDLFAIDKIDSSVAPTLMTELSDAELDKHRVQGGDLLFCRTSVAAEGVGKCSIVRDASSPLVPASNLIRVRVDPDKVDPCFAYYYFRSAAGSKQLRNMVRGAAVFTITGGDIGLVEFPRFALADQSQIASMLDAFDGLIENNRRRIELLEETARLLYREWFVNFRYPGHEGMPLVDSEIGPIPEHWRVETLGDLAEVVKDTVGPASIPSGSPLVGLEHLPRRSTTLADWDLATEVGSRRAIFRDGDVLFGKIRPYFHKVVETPFSGYCSTDAVVLRPVRDSDSAQLLSVVSSDDFIAHASASANGTKMPRANMDVLMRFPVPRPTESVSQAFEETAKPLTELAKQLIRTNSRLTEARDLLLPRLVSGDLDMSDFELNLEAVG